MSGRPLISAPLRLLSAPVQQKRVDVLLAVKSALVPFVRLPTASAAGSSGGGVDRGGFWLLGLLGIIGFFLRDN